jgi:hypothetical protein
VKEHALHCAVTCFALCPHALLASCCGLASSGVHMTGAGWMYWMQVHKQYKQSLGLCLRAGQQRHACTNCLCALTS